MSLKPSEVLSEAAGLLSKPGAWTQNAVARDASGDLLWNERDSHATCFCASGAIGRIAGPGKVENKAADYLQKILGGNVIPDWNDEPTRKQSQVVEALRKASALALSEGQ